MYKQLLQKLQNKNIEYIFTNFFHWFKNLFYEIYLPNVNSGGEKSVHLIVYIIGILLFAGLIGPWTANSYAAWLWISTPHNL